MDYQRALLGLNVFGFLFERYMNTRQLRRLNHSAPPPALQSYFGLLKDSSNFLPSQNYSRDKLKFGQLGLAIGFLESFAFTTSAVSLLLGSNKQSGFKVIWDYSGSFPYVQRHGQIVHSMAYAVCLSVLSQLTSIPASLYSTFVIEEKHGFNKMTIGLWLKDFVKGQALGAAIGLPIVAALLKIIDYAGQKFVNYTMAFIVVLQIVMIPLSPLFMRIFNKFTAIQDFKDKEHYIDVSKRVEKLAKKLNFPLGKIWVMDGSTRSAHSNAFFFGMPFLTKHIVLYDTLLDQNSPEEVEAVLAHELGHWVFNHSVAMLIFGQATLFVNLSLIRLTLFNPAMYRAFSFTHERPILVGLALSTALMSPLDTVLSFVINAISRRNEFQADKFAYDLATEENQYAEKLKSALIRLGDKNKAVTDVDPLYSAYKHSHPTMPERIARLDNLIAQGHEKKE